MHLNHLYVPNHFVPSAYLSVFLLWLLRPSCGWNCSGVTPQLEACDEWSSSSSSSSIPDPWAWYIYRSMNSVDSFNAFHVRYGTYTQQKSHGNPSSWGKKSNMFNSMFISHGLFYTQKIPWEIPCSVPTNPFKWRFHRWITSSGHVLHSTEVPHSSTHELHGFTNGKTHGHPRKKLAPCSKEEVEIEIQNKIYQHHPTSHVSIFLIPSLHPTIKTNQSSSFSWEPPSDGKRVTNFLACFSVGWGIVIFMAEKYPGVILGVITSCLLEWYRGYIP